MRLSGIMAVISLAFSGQVYAGECGIGKIVSYIDGGWDQDNLTIKLDTKLPTQHPDTFWANEYVRFEHSRLGDSRYNGMRSTLLSAFMAGKTIRIYSHSNRCDSATEVTIYAN